LTKIVMPPRREQSVFRTQRFGMIRPVDQGGDGPAVAAAEAHQQQLGVVLNRRAVVVDVGVELGRIGAAEMQPRGLHVAQRRNRGARRPLDHEAVVVFVETADALLRSP
jgi:hypothetical protein